jgi:hypothetical protein
MKKMFEVPANKLVPGRIYYTCPNDKLSVRFVKLDTVGAWFKRIKNTGNHFTEGSNGLLPFDCDGSWYSYRKH